MRNISSLFTKLAVAGVMTFSVMAVGIIGTAEARIPYNGDGMSTSSTPIFNAFYNVPNGVGDEADFVRVKPKAGTNAEYVNSLNAACNVGDAYTVRTYVHNGASPDYNNNGSGSAVARDVVVKMTAPLNTPASTFQFKSTISASNASSVTDTATIKCGDKTVKLSLIAGSVQTYSKPIGFKTVSDSAVNGSLKIGSRVQGSGDVWGCWDDRVIVTFEVKIEKVPAQPKESIGVCKDVVVRESDGRTIRVTVSGTTENATIVGYEINFGDGTIVKEQTATHIYAKDGTYTVVGRVQVKYADGTTKWVTADKCKQVVKFTTPEQPEEPETPEEPEIPPVMPETGAAGAIALFTGVSAAGAAAHRFVTTRRLNK